MKVLPILSQNYYVNNNKINKQNKSNQTTPFSSLYLSGVPKSYISFRGGDSLDLWKTLALLRDKYERCGEEQEPFLVNQEILKELSMRNPDNKTLIDIHKQVYGKLTTLNDLTEIKELYPTFRLVKKSDEVDFKDNKFIAEIRNGNNPIFNNQEDLSVQLIKLYWGEGFSLSDIAKQANTKPSTIGAVMEKLNIERVTPYYGKILKLSDKEYNERFTREMAEKRELIAAQKRGEPYIPRKPLTKEQKQHISESLIKFYSAHPERLSEMSERQKEFYKTHPEAALIFKFVMLKAWNMESCAAVRRKLKTFLEENNIQIEKQEKEPSFEHLSRLQSKKMKIFWDTHPYEKKKFAKGVEYAWDKINSHKNIELIKSTVNVPLFPKVLQETIKKWAIEEKKKTNLVLKNTDISNFAPSIAFQLFPLDLIAKTEDEKIINNFFKNNKEHLSLINNAMSFLIIGIHHYYKKAENVDKELANQISTHIDKTMEAVMRKSAKSNVQMEVNEVVKLYAEVLTMAKNSGNIDEFNKMVKAFNLIYGKDFNSAINILFVI